MEYPPVLFRDGVTSSDARSESSASDATLSEDYPVSSSAAVNGSKSGAGAYGAQKKLRFADVEKEEDDYDEDVDLDEEERIALMQLDRDGYQTPNRKKPSGGRSHANGFTERVSSSALRNTLSGKPASSRRSRPTSAGSAFHRTRLPCGRCSTTRAKTVS